MNPAVKSDPLFKIQEAAEYLRVARQTLYNLVNRKEIPFLKAGGSLRFRKSELDEWLLDGAGRSAEKPAEEAV
ncbi:hypothetical protein LCGC14_1258140 [marine sediment metagenome]|uniref:Helix-turn-helix domain-containing protein n=1 Tax=marine sediment metagenome TaxID=412755 RepID=A0A0F9L442_9ZZZZ